MDSGELNRRENKCGNFLKFVKLKTQNTLKNSKNIIPLVLAGVGIQRD